MHHRGAAKKAAADHGHSHDAVNGSVSATPQRAGSGPRRPSAPPPRKPPKKRLILLGLVVGLALGIGVMVYLSPDGPPLVPMHEFLRILDPSGQLQYNPFVHLTALGEMIPAMPSFATNYSLFSESVKPGRALLDKGYKWKHPVIMIPGFITSGLELWDGDPCAMKYFRQRMWGTFAMVQSMLLDPQCWMDHIALDPDTGLDPPGRKLRPAQGFEAADYFVPGYWVWGKLIENLALLGYDHNNMLLMSYDWRLAPEMLEERDMYFTRLKSVIEFMVNRWRTKACLVSHSMGSNVVFYFLKWVESPKGGNGGPDWVATYVDSFANLAGPVLGVHTALSSLLSGEMKDTANLGPLEPYLMRDAFGPARRRQLFRSWYSLLWMAPKGGDSVWGNTTSAPDDPPAGMDATPPSPKSPPAPGECPPDSLGCAVRFRDGSHRNLTTEAVLDVLRRNSTPPYGANMDRWFSFGLAEDPTDDRYDDPRYWSNPLESALPRAPNLTIHCLYGIGLETERAYYYAPDPKCGINATPSYVIDRGHNTAPAVNGVLSGPGDGSVPLFSLGFMCARGWRERTYNPHGVRVVSREFQHQKSGFAQPRGGVASGQHIDIMGNTEFLKDILTIACGHGDTLEDRIVSDIERIAANVPLPDSSPSR